MQVILFDTETTDLVRNTGLPLEKQPKIIELYAKKLQLPVDAWGNKDEWETLGEFDMLFNPGMPIPEEVVKITHITDEMVKDAPSISEHWADIVDFFSGADHDVAHNLAYDRQIMAFEQARHGTGEFPFAKKGICTVEGTLHLKGFRLNLQALHEELFGEGFPEAHRAKNDVEAMERCFKQLWEDGEI